MSNQKMREALQAAYEAHQDDFDQPWLSLAAEALAAPAGEQVELTDDDELLTTLKMALPHINPKAVSRKMMMQSKSVDDCYINTIVRRVIAAHEAKRVSCSQIAKKSTCDGGRVDGIEKSEHVGGAA